MPKQGISVIYPYVSSTWIIALITFYSLSPLTVIHSDTIRVYFKSGEPLLKCCSKFSMYYWKYYYYIITSFSFLILIRFFIYNNDAGLWSIVLTIQGLFNITLQRQFDKSPLAIVSDVSEMRSNRINNGLNRI